jgi:hypothetical protein
MGRARPAGARGIFNAAAPAADAESGNKLFHIGRAAFRAANTILAAYPDEGLETASALAANKFVYRHSLLF